MWVYSLLLLDKNIFLTNMANPFPNKKTFVDLKTVFFFKSLNHFQQFENYVSKVQTVNIRQYLEHPHIFVKTNQKHIFLW